MKHLLTHEPKVANCDVCLRSRAQHTPKRKGKPQLGPAPEKLGDQMTVDHLIRQRSLINALAKNLDGMALDDDGLAELHREIENDNTLPLSWGKRGEGKRFLLKKSRKCGISPDPPHPPPSQARDHYHALIISRAWLARQRPPPSPPRFYSL